MQDKQAFIHVGKLKELRHNIFSSIRQMNRMAEPSGMSDRIFEQFIEPILSAYQPVFSPLASHNGSTIYRARRCVGDNPFVDEKELYNPPNPSGRAFRSGNTPILYASSSMQTCLFEKDPKIGEYFTIAHFDYSSITSGLFWFIGQLGSFHKSAEPSHYLGDTKPVHKPFYYPATALHSWVFKDSLINEIYSTLASQLGADGLSNRLITEIGKKLPDEEHLQGVVFSSIKDSPGTNFAIYGDAINQVKLKTANHVRITDIDDYEYVEYQLLRNARVLDSGDLNWPEYELDGV